MQFQAKVAGVSATATSKSEAPVKLQVKLEPLYLDDPGWLLARVGDYVVVQVMSTSLPLTPLEEAIEAVNGR